MSVCPRAECPFVTAALRLCRGGSSWPQGPRPRRPLFADKRVPLNFSGLRAAGGGPAPRDPVVLSRTERAVQVWESPQVGRGSAHLRDEGPAALYPSQVPAGANIFEIQVLH